MTLQRFMISLAGVVLSLAASCAAAQGWVALLRDTPAEKFNEDDLKLHLEAARRALNEAREGGSVGWHNAATSAGGELLVQKVFTWQNLPCRELLVRTEARGIKGENTVNLCQVDGQWRGVSPSELAKKP